MDWSQLEALAREMGIEELGALWLQRGELIERIGAFPPADQREGAKKVIATALRKVTRPMWIGSDEVRRLHRGDERHVVQKW